MRTILHRLVLSALLALGTLASATGAPAEQPAFPDSPYLPDLTPGYVIVQGCIQIPEAQFISMTKGEITAAGTFGPATLWPGGAVPFDFVTTGVGAVSAANQDAAIGAMNAISSRAGVTFRQATSSDANRIRFQNSQFNNSPVGMVGGTQIINIVSWGSEIIICHEIYHSLGFQHEQSRLDRGTFVTINLANICGSGVSVGCTSGLAAGQCCLCVDNAGNCIPCNFNFGTVNNSFTYGPYDFDSFMHYGPTAFTCNGQNTITVNSPWDTQWQNAIGQRDHFSYYDAINCRAQYPFPNDRWVQRDRFGLPFGTFQDPFLSTTLADALAGTPSGGTLFVKFGNTYSGVGKHTKTVTIVAPVGDVRFGN